MLTRILTSFLLLTAIARANDECSRRVEVTLTPKHLAFNLPTRVRASTMTVLDTYYKGNGEHYKTIKHTYNMGDLVSSAEINAATAFEVRLALPNASTVAIDELEAYTLDKMSAQVDKTGQSMYHNQVISFAYLQINADCGSPQGAFKIESRVDANPREADLGDEQSAATLSIVIMTQLHNSDKKVLKYVPAAAQYTANEVDQLCTKLHCEKFNLSK